MALISFILNVSDFTIKNKDLSNQQVFEKTKIELERINNELSEKISYEINKLNQPRIARIDTILKRQPKKKSANLDTIKTGQQVLVIEIQKKYILVTYMSEADNEIKVGFTLKKHFDIID